MVGLSREGLRDQESSLGWVSGRSPFDTWILHTSSHANFPLVFFFWFVAAYYWIFLCHNCSFCWPLSLFYCLSLVGLHNHCEISLWLYCKQMALLQQFTVDLLIDSPTINCMILGTCFLSLAIIRISGCLSVPYLPVELSFVFRITFPCARHTLFRDQNQGPSRIL